jgi:hypothetical protein
VTFSLKYLFVFVAIAAVFNAALIFRTPPWAIIAINTAVVTLLVPTVGLWLGRLDRTFWLPFCVVGWFYLVVALTPQSINRLAAYLPSGQAVVKPVTGGALLNEQRFADVIDTVAALLFGGLAGIIASLLLRKKPEA